MARACLGLYHGEFASTYPYLAVSRIGPMAEAAADVHWRPFLLGPIFAAQGQHRHSTPILKKGAICGKAHLERLAARYGLPPVVEGRSPS